MALDFSDFDYTIGRGNDERILFTIKNATGNAALDVTGWTFWFTAKVALTEPDPGVFQRTTVNGGIVVIAAASGQIAVDIRGADTSPLLIETVVLCDLQAKDAANKISTPQTGKLTIKRDVTQATA